MLYRDNAIPVYNLNTINMLFQESKRFFALPLLAIVFFATSCNRTPQGPALKFSSKTLSLGKLRSGEIRNGIMKIWNTGTTPLVISSVKAGCHCTSIKVEKDTINPNQSGNLAITYVADSLKSGSQTFESPVVVRSNSGKIFHEFMITGIVFNDHKL